MNPNPSHRTWAFAAALVSLLAFAAAPVHAACIGDCDADGAVAVNEIITGVNIALGNSGIDACPVFDTDATGTVEIYELIIAVGNLLNGCTAGPPSKASKSSPIAVSPDGSLVVTANIDTDTISIFTVGAGGLIAKVKEVAVGHEPRSVAMLSNKPWVYVANTLSGTVQVISLLDYSTIATIPVGTEPWAVVAAANGLYVYAANASSNTVSAIDTASNVVFATIPVGRSPRALAITNDGDADDLDERIYVPNFYARPRVGFAPPSTGTLGGTDPANAFPSGSRDASVVGEGIFDDSREAVIDVIDAASNSVVDQVVLGPVADTGFKVARGAFVTNMAGDAPRTIFADGGTDGTVPQATGAFPNLLLSIALFGERGFVPSTAASPEPPLRFNTNVQSLLSVFDLTSGSELADQTFNLNKGVNFDVPAGLSDAQNRDNTDRLFPSAPVDIDCSEATDSCWVVSQGSDFVVKLTFGADGKPTINAPTAAGTSDVSPVTRLYTIDPADPLRSGRNPRGIALSADGTRGYVTCPTTRDVVVLDLVGNSVLQDVRASELPTSGSVEETIRRGKIDFFTARPFWSDRGWGACWSCHPDGGSDTVTWAFEAGPRQTIALDGTFSHVDPEDQRTLNWSPVRDENQDFELNTRGVFGGRGFIITDTDQNADGITPDSDPNVHNFGPASSGRAQQQEDLTAYIQLAIRSPLAPPASADAARGRTVFAGGAGGANCIACHSGSKWTVSRVTYDPSDVNPVPGTQTGVVNIPPVDLDHNGSIDDTEAKAISVYLNGFNSAAGAGRICEVPPPPGVDNERIRIVRQVGTFTAANPIEARANAISPINTVAPALAVNAAFGGEGFSAPSLLGVFDTAPYLHNGAVPTLDALFGIGTDAALLPAVQAHWRAGTGGNPNILDTDSTAAAALIAFVKSIDERTTPFPAANLAPDDPTFADAAALCDCAKEPPLGTPAIDCRP